MKIVVATDFSANSKKAILFALQIAKQTDCELVFYNSLYIYQPTIWETSYYNIYQNEELARTQNFLDSFIKKIDAEAQLKDTKHSCICEIGLNPGSDIIDFATKSNANFICVGTLGAGKLVQIFGTTASELIAFSTIPVFVVPVDYVCISISNLFFAADFINFEKEFSTIKAFSDLFLAHIDVYHFDQKNLLNSDQSKFNITKTKHKADRVAFHFRDLDADRPLIARLEAEVKRSNPSVVIVFTKQNRNWFERLFLSSLSDELAFDTKTPMLIFKKD